MGKVLAVLSGVAVALVLVAAPAVAQSTSGDNGSPCAPGGPNANGYPPRDCGLHLGNTQVGPGGTVTVSGDYCGASSAVSISLDDTKIDGTTADSNGSFSKVVTIPSDTKPGSHTITATCTTVLGEQISRSAAITVVAPAAAGHLPKTGGDLTLPLVLVAAVLLGLGGVAVVASRRRSLTE